MLHYAPSLHGSSVLERFHAFSSWPKDREAEANPQPVHMDMIVREKQITAVFSHEALRQFFYCSLACVAGGVFDATQ